MKRSNIWLILFVIMVGQIIGTFSTEGIIAPLAPFFRRELALNRAQIGSLTSAIFMGSGLVALISGWLADTLGSRLVLSAGLLIMASAAFLFSKAQAFAAAWTFAFLGGIGYSTVQPSTVKGIISWFPEHNRAAMVSLKQAGVPIGAAGATGLLVYIAGAHGWRAAAVAAAFIALAAAGLVFFLYREPDGRSSPGKGKKGRSPASVISDNRDLKLLLMVGPARTGAHYCAVSYLILFLVENRYCSAVAAAGFLALLQTVGIFGNLGWGVLSDLVGGRRRTILSLATAAGVLGSLLFAVMPGRLWPAAAWPAIVLFGLGVSGAGGLLSVTTAEIGGKENTGATVGMSSASSCIGIMLFPPFFGWIVDTTGSYRLAWGVVTILASLVTFLVLNVRHYSGSARRCDSFPQKPTTVTQGTYFRPR